MALITFEGFDYMGTPNTSNDITFKQGCSGPLSAAWTKVTGLSASGSAINLNNSNTLLKFTPGGNYSTLIVGFRFKADTAAAFALQNIFNFVDGSSVQCGLGINASGQLIFWRGTNATVKGTGTTVLVQNSIYFIEVKVTFSTSAVATDGTFEVRLDTVPEIGPTSGVNITTTASGTASQVGLGKGTNTLINFTWDDFYVCDGTTSANNTFLGIIRVETLFPTANSSVTFTPLASTNVSQVQETTADGDTSYNASSTSGDIDLFTHGSLTGTPTTIFGAQVVSEMRKDDVSAQTVRTKLVSAGTTQNGASNVPVTIYQFFADLYANDPHTGSAWNATNLNGSTIGYEHV